MINTDCPWNLNWIATPPGSPPWIPQAHNPLPSWTHFYSELNYQWVKQWACAVSPTAGWAPWCLHSWHLKWFLAIVGARWMLWTDTRMCVWVCACACSGLSVITQSVTYFCYITSCTPPIFSNVNNKCFVQITKEYLLSSSNTYWKWSRFDGSRSKKTWFAHLYLDHELRHKERWEMKGGR